MTEFAPLPISRATNSYDLLEELKAVIREEPKRLHMDWWVAAHLGSRRVDCEEEIATLPACGTVACAAGWIVELRREFRDEIDFSTSRQALKSFPLRVDDQLRYLFDHSPLGRYGSLEYVESVIDRIAGIQEDSESDLKDFVLVPPTESAS